MALYVKNVDILGVVGIRCNLKDIDHATPSSSVTQYLLIKPC